MIKQFDKWHKTKTGLLVFLFARCFTDENNIGRRITIAEYQLRGTLAQLRYRIVGQDFLLNIVKFCLLGACHGQVLLLT